MIKAVFCLLFAFLLTGCSLTINVYETPKQNKETSTGVITPGTIYFNKNTKSTLELKTN